jgi:hypothetical protein
VDVKKAEQELGKLLNEFRDWDEARRRDAEAHNLVTSPVYHYCDMASLAGIVQHSQLWLSSIFHLNDPSELRYGRDLAIKHLDGVPEGPVMRLDTTRTRTIVFDTRRPVDRFCMEMTERLKTDYSGVFGFFVGSFSRTADDLAQWRSYADDGRGVAIEVSSDWFQPTAVDVRTAPIQDVYSVSNVVYNESQAEQRQKEAIDRALDVIRRAEKAKLLEIDKLASEFFSQLRVALSVPLLWNCVTTKHPAYAHEAETRLILVNDKGKLAKVTKTRTRGPQLVSYIPIEFPAASIPEARLDRPSCRWRS